MGEIDAAAVGEWYVKNRVLYERLADSVRATLLNSITHANIQVLSITCRAKEVNSFTEKVARKGYKDPRSEMTDLAGIRIIAFIESDVEKIGEIIKTSFNVHPDKSLDKRSELGKDRFGYRSIHFVCDLGGVRLGLSENVPYAGIVFEIQVRTVLQHAWAEIEHDRGYKFGGKLRQDIERRLHSQAAILEAVDREFDRLAQEIDEYSADVATNAATGDLNFEIDTTSLLSYLPRILAENGISKVHYVLAHSPGSVFAELSDLGIRTLADLDTYFSPEFFRAYHESVVDAARGGVKTAETDAGLIRSALLYADAEKYFETTKPGWNVSSHEMTALLDSKYGVQAVDKLFERYQIDNRPRGRLRKQ